jgi:hypothetical protein
MGLLQDRCGWWQLANPRGRVTRQEASAPRALLRRSVPFSDTKPEPLPSASELVLAEPGPFAGCTMIVYTARGWGTDFLPRRTSKKMTFE